MDMIVCVKQVPDLETALANFRIDSETNRVIPVAGAGGALPLPATKGRTRSQVAAAAVAMPAA